VTEGVDETDFTNRFTCVSDLSYTTAVRRNEGCRKKVPFGTALLGPRRMNTRENQVVR
jgi:hypothetical protein